MPAIAASSAAGLTRVRPLAAAGLLAALSGVGIAAVAAGASVERVCVLLALAPLLEEALFRLGLHDALLKRLQAPHLANALTALAFGVAHVAVRNDLGGLAVMAPALLIGWVYERWGQLRLCVALHAVMNAVWLSWALAGAAVRVGS